MGQGLYSTRRPDAACRARAAHLHTLEFADVDDVRTMLTQTMHFDTELRRGWQDAAMASFLHTMVRITDPEASRRFYEALGFSFSRDMDIVRDGKVEATNYFYSLGDDENVLELTYNHDGRTYELGTAYGHIALSVDDLDSSLEQLAGQGITPEREPYRVREGGSRLCFVNDPDGYRIELIDRSGR